MAFTIPDESSAGHPDQAEPKTLDFQALARRDTGVVSGCAVTAQVIPDMTVAVSSGTVCVTGVRHAVTGANVTITANVSGNPRYDAIVADSSGVLSAVAGVPASEATLDQPLVDLDTHAVLAIVYVSAGAVSIVPGDIVRKDINQNPNAFHDEDHALNDPTVHTGLLDDAQIPAGIARDAEVTSAVSAHTAASDPHGDRAAAATDATTKVTTHEGAADPHLGYQKESEKGAASGYADLDSNVKVPAARLPAPTSTLLGGVKSHAAVSHEFLTSIATDGAPVGATITLSDVPALLDSSFALTGDITPTALSADVNDYNPTGLANVAVIRQATNDTTTRTITGLAGGADGRMIYLHNLGPGKIVLSDEDALSTTAGDRFALVADVVMAPDAVALLQYDFTSQRWRVMARTSGTTPALAFDVSNVAGVSDQFLRADDHIAIFDNTLPSAIGAAATGGIVGPTILDALIDTSDAAAFTTASIDTAAHYNELITIAVHSEHATTDPNIPTLTTARGLSLAQVNTRLNTTDHRRITIFRTCIAAGGSAGTLVIDFAGQTQQLCAWEVLSWRGTGATAANNGSDGIGVSQTGTATSNVTTLGVTLSALEAGSAVYAAVQHEANENASPAAGYTELTDVHTGGPTTSFETNWKLAGTTTPGGSWATASHASMAACEILAPATVNFAARRGHVHATGAGTPSTQAFGDTAATGSGPGAAMYDHLHGMPTPSLGTTTAAVGTSAGGSATSASKSDHVHATGAGTPSTQASGDAAAIGSGPNAAMDNHKHAMWNDFIVVTFSKQGAVVVTTDTTAGRWYNDTGRTLTFSSVRATAVTAPTGATLIVDVNKDGTTIFTTQASRPTIAISGNTNKVTNPDVTTIADGSYLTVNVDQIGSTVAGSDLTVQIFMKG